MHINKEEQHLFLVLLIGYMAFVMLYLFCKRYKIKINLAHIIEEVMNQKIKKKVLVNYYAVDKTTFRKWVLYFCLDVFPNHNDYLKKHKLTLGEAIQLVSVLGLTSFHSVCSKRDIIETGEGSYRSLRESIIQFPNLYGISQSIYTDLRVFPPNISERISKYYA